MAGEGTATTPDGRRLAYVERGTPGGLPVVFNHGTPGSRLSRHPDPTIYERHGIRGIAYDRPGYGGSDPDPGRTVASAAADVGVIADELGFDRFAVVGVSGGGPHALACAALLPDRVLRAGIMVGAAPSDDPEFDFLSGMAQLNLDEFEAARTSKEAIEAYLEPYVEQLRTNPDAAIEEMVPQLPEPDRRELARDDVRAILREAWTEAVRQGVRGWADDDLAFAGAWGFELEDVTPEVRLWQGEEDVLVPRAHCEYLARRIPNARFELIPGAGHFINERLPVVLDWLAAA